MGLYYPKRLKVTYSTTRPERNPKNEAPPASVRAPPGGAATARLGLREMLRAGIP